MRLFVSTAFPTTSLPLLVSLDGSVLHAQRAPLEALLEPACKEGVAASWLLQSDGDHLHGWQWLRLSVLTQCLQRTDLPLSQHCLRVQRTARQLARHLALSHEEMTAVELAAPFHDLGKLGLAPTILHKAAPLTAQEFEEVKQHSALGARMLRSLGISEQVASQGCIITMNAGMGLGTPTVCGAPLFLWESRSLRSRMPLTS